MSRFPLPDLNTLPEDLRAKILEVQEKSGFVPNVFLAFARRPAEWRAFFAYHDALMLREESSLTMGERAQPKIYSARWPLVYSDPHPGVDHPGEWVEATKPNCWILWRR